MKTLYRVVHEDESQTLHSYMPATEANQVDFPRDHECLVWVGDVLTVYERGDVLPTASAEGSE